MKQVSSCGLELFYFGLFCANSTHFSSLWLMLLLFSLSASVGLFRKGLLALPGKHNNHPHPKKWGRASGINGMGPQLGPSQSPTGLAWRRMDPLEAQNWCTQQVLGHGDTELGVSLLSHVGKDLKSQSSHIFSCNKSSSTTASSSKSMVIWGEESPLYLLINY